MALTIDDTFIRKWHPKYDLIEKDETQYVLLRDDVACQLSLTGNISKETFVAIWKWKGAIRAQRHLRMDLYDTMYAPAFRRAASKPPEQMLGEILSATVKLPGVGVPSGSTLLHFLAPSTIPIMDVRTVEVLYKANLIHSKQRDYKHYEAFRLAIKEIADRFPNWSLRQIDRALFAYHKLEFENSAGIKCDCIRI